MKKLIILLIFFSILIFVSKKAFSVYFATNKIILYEDGKRVTDSSVIYGEYSYDPVCKNGICNIGQQYSTVTFYKTKNTNNFNKEDFTSNWYLTHPGCEMYETKKTQISAALEEWGNSTKFKAFQDRVNKASTIEERKVIWAESDPVRRQFMKNKGFSNYEEDPTCFVSSNQYDIYFKNLISNAIYVKKINFPAPTGGKGCGYKNCMGGRIGDDRTFNVDLMTESVELQGTSRAIAIQNTFFSFLYNIFSSMFAKH